jgi:hypothetical protein
MTVNEALDLAVLPVIESPHVMAILLRVSVKAYADAARQLKDGNRKASPLTMALLEHGSYVMCGYIADRIWLRDSTTGQRYSALIPAVLVEYFAGFQRGVRVFEDYEFELILVSDEA